MSLNSGERDRVWCVGMKLSSEREKFKGDAEKNFNFSINLCRSTRRLSLNVFERKLSHILTQLDESLSTNINKFLSHRCSRFASFFSVKLTRSIVSNQSSSSAQSLFSLQSTIIKKIWSSPSVLHHRQLRKELKCERNWD